MGIHMHIVNKSNIEFNMHVCIYIYVYVLSYL